MIFGYFRTSYPGNNRHPLCGHPLCTRINHLSGIASKSIDTMAGKKYEYSKYGTTPGGASHSHPQSPIGGSKQPNEIRKMESVKTTVERILQGLDIRYPIASKNEFMEIITPDIPGICDIGNKKLSMRDLIFSLRDDDFPIKSDHEAANLLAASCPIIAQAAE